jgi:hypothetical protein
MAAVAEVMTAVLVMVEVTAVA